MRKPFQHTLTPADRKSFDRWLIGVCAFYASVALFAVGCIVASQYFTGSTRTDTAAMSRAR
jgi:hypothetical protein